MRTGTAIVVSLLATTAIKAQGVSPFPEGITARTGIFTHIQPLPTHDLQSVAELKPVTEPTAAETSVSTTFRPVKVPLPPVLDRKLRPKAPATAAILPQPQKHASETAETMPETQPAASTVTSDTWKPVKVPVPPALDPALRPKVVIATATVPAMSVPEAAPVVADAAPVPAEAEPPKGWKSVAVPKPPRLDKKLRILAVKADREKLDKLKAEKAATDKEKLEQAALTPIKAVEPPAPAPPKIEPVAPVPAPAAEVKITKDKRGKGRDALAKAAPAAEPVVPAGTRSTGIFSLFDKQLAAAEQADLQDSSRLVMPDSASAFASPTRKTVRTASLGLLSPLRQRRNSDTRDDDLEDEESGVTLEKQVASVQTACLKPQLVAMIKKAGEHFGTGPVITSGFRSNGRRGSLHRRCEAADFQIPGVSSSQIVAYLRSLPGAGGVGTYCHTKSVHLDTGIPRNWHQCGFQRSFALREPILAASQ